MSESQEVLPGLDEDSREARFAVTFPQTEAESIAQDQEYCLVTVDGHTRRIRFHDYHEIYAIPGLYEQIFYEELDCQSPTLIGMLLEHEAGRIGLDMDELAVLDVGAGNGMMGEVMARAGVDSLVGVDILPEAKRATQRDRPGLYDAYHAVDLLDLPRDVHDALQAQRFDCMTLVAALGFGDIPPEAFTVAYNFVEDGGLVAFNLKELFLDGRDRSGFARLVGRMLEEGWLEESMRVRYVHRRSVTGEPLFYTAIIGRKARDIPEERAGRREDN